MMTAQPTLDVAAIRAEFPILNQEIQGRPLVYLDNAATTHTPDSVLKVVEDYYQHYNSNIHRGTHRLSQLATAKHEAARTSIAAHLNAKEDRELIFTSGCTDSINLVANILRQSGKIGEGDEILVSELDHHSNIVPWQMLAEAVGAKVLPIPVTEKGEIDLDTFKCQLSERTRILAVNHISNALGTINPVKEMTRLAHEFDAYVLIDGAQAIPHLKIDVQDLDCDFYTFSGHKVYGPTGIGALWGRAELLESLPPWRGGGEMIKKVSFSGTTYNELPFKYEAGTPDIEGGIALAAAIEWVHSFGIDAVAAHEDHLLKLAEHGLRNIPGLKIYGQAENKASVVSFLVDGIHPYDLGTLLDQMGIAVRTGHHCCQPLMERYDISGTVRASFAIYNTAEEVEAFLAAVQKAVTMLS